MKEKKDQKQSKAEFVRSMGTKTVAEIVQTAKSRGIELDPEYVYKVRSAAKAKPKAKKSPGPGPAKAVPRRSNVRQLAVGLLDAGIAAVVAGDKDEGVRALRAAKAFID